MHNEDSELIGNKLIMQRKARHLIKEDSQAPEEEDTEDLTNVNGMNPFHSNYAPASVSLQPSAPLHFEAASVLEREKAQSNQGFLVFL
jgi:hypothetical protein